MPPKRFPDRDEIAAVREEAEQLEAGQEGQEKRRLAGRVMARREHGKLTFLDLVAEAWLTRAQKRVAKAWLAEQS